MIRHNLRILKFKEFSEKLSWQTPDSKIWHLNAKFINVTLTYFPKSRLTANYKYIHLDRNGLITISKMELNFSSKIVLSFKTSIFITSSPLLLVPKLESGCHPWLFSSPYF